MPLMPFREIVTLIVALSADPVNIHPDLSIQSFTTLATIDDYNQSTNNHLEIRNKLINLLLL